MNQATTKIWKGEGFIRNYAKDYIWKQMEQNPRKISNIKFLSAKESQRRQNIGSE
jgi:hypothetical protein